MLSFSQLGLSRDQLISASHHDFLLETIPLRWPSRLRRSLRYSINITESSENLIYHPAPSKLGERNVSLLLCHHCQIAIFSNIRYVPFSTNESNLLAPLDGTAIRFEYGIPGAFLFSLSWPPGNLFLSVPLGSFSPGAFN